MDAKQKRRNIFYRILMIVLALGILALLITGLTISAVQKNDVDLIILFSVLLLAFLVVTLLVYFWRRKTRVATENIIKNNAELASITERKLESGIMIYDEEGTIVFVSKWLYELGFSLYLGKPVTNVPIDFTSPKEQYIQTSGRTYSVVSFKKTSTLFIKDVTEEERLKQDIYLREPAVIFILRKYSNEAKISEIYKLRLDLKIDEYIEKWVKENGGVFYKVSNSRSTIVTRWYDIESSFNERNKFLKDLFEKLGKQSKDVSISIGISRGDKKFGLLKQESMEAQEKAQNRGGNQVVINNPNGELTYLGTSIVSKQDNSKVGIKFFYDHFIGQVTRYREVFITSHNFADLDAMASAIGIATLLGEKQIAAKIILPVLDETSTKLFNSFSKNVKRLFISEKEAIEKVTRKSALVVTDVSDKSRIQAPELLERIHKDDTYVIDHHRIGFDVINTRDTNTYIDTTASSVSEIISEMLIFNEDLAKSGVTKEIATALLAGIYLDTNQLTKNTSSRTFEALSFLTKKKADSDEVIDLLKSDISDIPLYTKALNSAQRIGKNILFASIPESEIIKDKDVSILANKLLSYQGIKASVVLARVDKDRYKMSARSINEVNVQMIAEELGGGGHFGMSSASWSKSENKYSDIKEQIKKAIRKQI